MIGIASRCEHLVEPDAADIFGVSACVDARRGDCDVSASIVYCDSSGRCAGRGRDVCNRMLDRRHAIEVEQVVDSVAGAT